MNQHMYTGATPMDIWANVCVHVACCMLGRPNQPDGKTNCTILSIVGTASPPRLARRARWRLPPGDQKNSKSGWRAVARHRRAPLKNVETVDF